MNYWKDLDSTIGLALEGKELKYPSYQRKKVNETTEYVDFHPKEPWEVTHIIFKDKTFPFFKQKIYVLVGDVLRVNNVQEIIKS